MKPLRIFAQDFAQGMASFCRQLVPGLDIMGSHMPNQPELHFHFSTGLSQEQFQTLTSQLKQILSKEDKIMADQDIAQAALDKIDKATTAQSAVLATESKTLQSISDEVDALIKAAQANGGAVTPEQLARLQTLADASDSISTSLQAQADFSAAIAAKGAPAPVPGPVPPATPAV